MKSISSVNEKQIANAALLLALATLIFGILSLDRLQTRYSVTQFLPENHPAIKMDQELRKRFQLADHPTFIAVLSLKKGEAGTWLEQHRIRKLGQLTDQLQQLSGVARVERSQRRRRRERQRLDQCGRTRPPCAEKRIGVNAFSPTIYSHRDSSAPMVVLF